MLQRYATHLVLGLSVSCLGLMACGDSTGDDSSQLTTNGDGDSGTGDGDGDGDPSGDGDGDPTGDGDGDPGDGDGDPTGDGDGDGDGDPSGDGDGDPGACEVWQITYDLVGSEFEISNTPFGAGDQLNFLMEPYDEDDHVGPGSFVLQFRDVDGQPGGKAFMYSYDMIMNFVVGGAVTVTTDLENSAGPDECGITSGDINGGDVFWEPPAIVGHHSMGTILCEGNLCGVGGFENGVPQNVDETTDHPIDTFTFNNDFSGFTMPPTVVQMDGNSTTRWEFVGTEVSRELVAAPGCVCP